MGARGLHLALDAQQLQRLLACEDPTTLRDELADIEEEWDEPWLCQTDKAWDAIHRCLSDGSLDVSASPSALEKAVLGGRELSEDESELLRLVMPKEAVEVARALEPITEPWLRERFFQLQAHGYEGPGDEDDCSYTWDYFKDLRDFYGRAASDGRAVIFSVDL